MLLNQPCPFLCVAGPLVVSIDLLLIFYICSILMKNIEVATLLQMKMTSDKIYMRISVLAFIGIEIPLYLYVLGVFSPISVYMYYMS